jgi:DNA-binding beta-propeller fold protein YncE
MRERKRAILCLGLFGAAVAGAIVVSSGRVQADDPNSAPNPYHAVDNWAKLPEGRVWGQAIGVEIDRDGRSVWIYDRCGGKTCEGSSIAPIQKFDASGRLVVAFGSGLINWPHGLGVDGDGNVWVTDGKADDGKGQTAIKFSPDGRVLMTLGKAGVAGDAPGMLNGPSDVLVTPNGNIFVADGHGDGTNDRIAKFSKDGQFIKAWGHHGSAPGEFNVPHGLAMDSAGRLFVADRSNNRVEIFDQDGNFLAEWKQFGRPSSVYVRDDILYVADSQSSDKVNAPFHQGIRIGSVKDGEVTAFIAAPSPDFQMPEGVAADRDGNVFGGFTDVPAVRKYTKN